VRSEAGRTLTPVDGIVGQRRGGVWRLTIDADCILDLIDPESDGRFKDQMAALAALAEGGIVELGYAGTIFRELARGDDRERAVRNIEALAGHPALTSMAPGMFRLDISCFDDPSTVLAGDAVPIVDAAIRQIMAPSLDPEASRLEKKIADVDHLLAHVAAGRDVFMTGNTNDFTQKRRLRLYELGIVVMTPAEILEQIRDEIAEDRSDVESLDESGA
jgi:hypothetical protein